MHSLIIVSGKAKAVFELFDSICQEYGHLSLGEIARDMSKSGLWILWEAK